MPTKKKTLLYHSTDQSQTPSTTTLPPITPRHNPSTNLCEEPSAKILAATVGQPEDEVGDFVLAHVGAGAVVAERTDLHILVQRLSQRPLVVIASHVARLRAVSTYDSNSTEHNFSS